MAEDQQQEQPDEVQSEETSAELTGLEQKLAAAEQKAEDNWNQFLRARAELENSRRRAERELEQAHKFALENFSIQLLAVRDSLEMGVAAAQDPQADVASLREGSELTLRMLTQVMEKFGVVEVDPQGQKFDPAKHEAIQALDTDDQEPNMVIQVVQKGYLLNDRLLRPAKVVVSKAGSTPPGGHIDEKV